MKHLVLAAVLAAAACQQPEAATLTVEQPYAYAQPKATEVAVYFVLRNPTDLPDTLVHVNAAEAAGVMFHRNVVDGTLVRMEHLETLAVGPRDSLVLEPGGVHLMLTDVRPIAPGDSIQLSLNFARGGIRLISVPVLSPGDPPPGPE